MRSCPLLLALSMLLASAAGCASTQPGASSAPNPGAMAPSAPKASPAPATARTAARSAATCPDWCPPVPSWATCSGGPPHPGCGYIPPSASSVSLFRTSAASSGTGCDSNRGLQCADGPPPPAPPPHVICPDMGTPCGLGPRQPGTIQFVVIGDWGDHCCQPSCAQYVADMIKKWNDRWPLDFIMTTGDNFYPDGSQDALNASMPMYDWIGPRPVSGQTPRFFPTLGNHDFYDGCCAKPYQDYFQALGDGSPTHTPRYYEYSLPGGFLHLFSINADDSEPDGNTKDGRQAKWLQQQLAQAGPGWRIVFFHEPPFSSHHAPDKPDGTPDLRWPFAEWGATLVLSGHIHAYERIVRNDFTYVTNGLGGVKGIDNITPAEGCLPVEGSQAVYNGSVGAMIGVATASELRFCMMALDRDHPDGACVDNFSFR